MKLMDLSKTHCSRKEDQDGTRSHMPPPLPRISNTNCASWVVVGTCEWKSSQSLHINVIANCPAYDTRPVFRIEFDRRVSSARFLNSADSKARITDGSNNQVLECSVLVEDEQSSYSASQVEIYPANALSSSDKTIFSMDSDLFIFYE